MRVENHRPFRFRRHQLAEYHRSPPGDWQQVRFDPARFQHLHQMRCVLLNVRRVAGNIRNRKELSQFSNDAVLILHPVFPHCLRHLRRRWWSWFLRDRRVRQGGNQQRDR